MSDEITRNWPVEAAAIAAGESRLLPEREHLIALAQHAESAIRHSVQLGEIVVAIMADNGVQQLPMPGGLLHSVRSRRLGLEIRPVMKEGGGPVADGSLVLKLARQAPVPTTANPTPKARVM